MEAAMGIDQALGIQGNAMAEWQRANSMQSMQQQQYWAMQNARSGPPMFTTYCPNLAAQDPECMMKHMQRYSRDCEYCGSSGSITDHGKGLMKCGNCGAS